jgi:transcriptional regulator of acetoin/glycerol metabolism
MERLAALHPGGVLQPDDLRDEFPPAAPLNNLCELTWKDARERYLADFELSYARSILARCNGNISAAAREAGVDRKTFYSLLKRDREQEGDESIPQLQPGTGE